MLARIARWALAPLALATAFTTVIAPPSGAVTGPNIAKDFEHPYVGLVAFYDRTWNDKWTSTPVTDVHPWTDEYSNLAGVILWRRPSSQE